MRASSSGVGVPPLPRRAASSAAVPSTSALAFSILSSSSRLLSSILTVSCAATHYEKASAVALATAAAVDASGSFAETSIIWVSGRLRAKMRERSAEGDC